MARLTRTQKYAELRDRLSQDREETILTEELAKYEKKLQNIEDAFSSVANKNDDVKPELKADENVVQEPAKQEKLPEEINPIELIEPVVLEEPKPEENKVEEINTQEAINEKIQSIEDMIEAMVCKVEDDITKIKPQEHERVTSLPIDEEIIKNIDENKSILDEEIEDVKIIENDVDTLTFDINEILDSIKMDDGNKPEPIEELQEPVYQNYIGNNQILTEVENEIESIDDILSQITSNAQNQTEEVVDFDIFDKELANVLEDAEKEEIVDVTPVVEEKEEIYPPKYETVYDAIKQEVAQITDLMDPSMKPAPIVEEAEPEKQSEEFVQENIEEPAQEIESETVVEEEPVKETEEESVQVETVESVIENEPVTDTEVEELPMIEEVLPEEITVPTVDNLFIEDTKDVEPIKDIAELDIDEYVNSKNDFINETLKEVDQYNKNEGRETLDTLPGKIIEEVRRSEKNEPSQKEDELFSQTVSLELDKVLSEISNTQEMPKEEIAELVEEEPEKIEEHPSLAVAKEKEEDGVVEIKNISETLKLNTNVLEDTIPFEINKPTAVEEEDYDDEDLEDEMPSKVLNVVLGILIVVLLLVLGIIIYYILVARGILG